MALVTRGFSEEKKLSIHLNGDGSRAKILLYIIGRGKNEFPFETVAEHEGRETESDIIVRNIVFDESIVDYKGNLVIKQGACKTRSFVAHHSLLLSKNAKVHSLPSLEIEADDVKAGHKATSGNIEEESLFYLMSRGFSRKEAEKILIEAFLMEDLVKIADAGLQLLIAKNIRRALSF
ncbi:SufD family Fe-S cluster assembly protein [Candidatus Peregrinibacteria bacterium]|nr:SufD family Fe-S cluster assembly protein [Candidatus Peregrinibacteria bacterium]